MFIVAVATSVYRFDQERNALFRTYQASARITAEIRVDYLQMLRLAEAFRNEPGQPALDRLKTAFDDFRNSAGLVQASGQAAGIDRVTALAAATSRLETYLPLLASDLQQVKPVDAGSVVPFLQRAETLDLLIAHMARQVFAPDSASVRLPPFLDTLDPANIILGIALATSLVLVLLGLVQVKRMEQLSGQNVRTRALLETRIRAIEATHEGIALIAPDGRIEFANRSTTVACECPRHVAELLMQLAQFERYSAQCANRNEADAQLHRFLQQLTVESRQRFESALTRIATHEGLIAAAD